MRNVSAADAEPEDSQRTTKMMLPCDDPEEWGFVEEVLGSRIESLADLDTVLTKFSALGPDPKVASFFSTVPMSTEAGKFDFVSFFELGVPLMVSVALQMPTLFAGIDVPIFKMRSSWSLPNILGKQTFSLTRRQVSKRVYTNQTR